MMKNKFGTSIESIVYLHTMEVISVKQGVKTASQLEVEIMQLIANDLQMPQVAKETGMSYRQLEGKLRRLRARFGCKSTIGLLALFFRNNLII